MKKIMASGVAIAAILTGAGCTASDGGVEREVIYVTQTPTPEPTQTPSPEPSQTPVDGQYHEDPAVEGGGVSVLKFGSQFDPGTGRLFTVSNPRKGTCYTSPCRVVTVKIENISSEAYDASLLMFSAQSGDASLEESLVDGESSSRPSAPILPGRTQKFDVGFLSQGSGPGITVWIDDGAAWTNEGTQKK